MKLLDGAIPSRGFQVLRLPEDRLKQPPLEMVSLDIGRSLRIERSPSSWGLRRRPMQRARLALFAINVGAVTRFA
jgi:hypothetical protein